MSKNKDGGFFGRTESWSRLDNAAKIFPSTSERTDTRVFRFYCELDEDVDRELLQEAAETTLESFPGFRTVMRKGFFWYYLEHCTLSPVVEEEKLPVCAEIYLPEFRNLLFRISYYKNAVNLETYHVISDGTGALSFLKELIYNYLLLKYPDEYITPPEGDSDASLSQKSDDSFRRYYKRSDGKDKEKRVFRAYNLKGEHTPDDRLSIIEGITSVKSVLNEAHKNKTTVTVFLTALFMQAIHDEMPISEMRYPMKISVPVNLRQFFPSETARNFFGMISVAYDFANRDGTLEDIISEVDKCFRRELTQERLAVRMNKMASIERNPFARIAPLPLKNLVLREARKIKDRGETAVVSNIGRIQMPEEMERHINMFGILISTLKTQMCVCSYKDRLQIGFTSGYTETDIQRNFFRALTARGIDVEIRSNGFHETAEN